MLSGCRPANDKSAVPAKEGFKRALSLCIVIASVLKNKSGGVSHPMAITKSEFYKLKRIRGLPASEKKKRWKAYQANIKSGQKPPRPPRPQKDRKGKGPMHGRPQLAECTDDFLLATLEPFKYNRQKMPCIPDDFVGMSQRVRARAFGVGVIGTAGFGFISLYEPCGIASDAAMGVITTVDYAGTTVAAPTTGAVAFYSDSVMSDTDFGSSKQWRVVGAAIRVTYIGTELNKSGVVTALATNMGTTLAGVSMTNSNQFRNAIPRSFANRKWHTVSRPLGGNTNDFVFVSTTPSTFSDMGVAIMVSGVAGEKFQYEAVAYHEVAGINLANPVPSESDSLGLAAVASMTARTTLSRAGDWLYTTGKQVALDYVKSNVSPYLGLPGGSRNTMRAIELLGDP